MAQSLTEVTRLFVYPVKSMKGIALDKAELTSRGLKFDRQWMVVRSSGRFVTQRELSRLALIQTDLTGNKLVLSMPDHGSVSIPTEGLIGEPVSSKVWKDDCETIDQGAEVSSWLTSALESETPLKLVAMNPRFKRSLHKSNLLGSGTTTHFADAAPLLVASESSLDALNTELETRGLDTVPMNRFRPNIVIKGLDPFSEHSVSELNSGRYALSLRYPCERCVIPTINQDTAAKDPNMQPFKTLAEINPMPENPRAPAFAENAVLLRGEGQQVKVGDQLGVGYR